MDLELAGNAVLCTAATSGLGRASAERFAREGADVAVCGTTPAHVDETREALDDIGDGDVLAVEADITDPDEVEAFVEETVETFGGLDHVVTSAGGPAPGPFIETTEREWYTAYDLLVMSVVWTTRHAYPYLRDSDAGTIVNITSRGAYRGEPIKPAYGASKAGLTSLSQSLAVALAPHKIFVGAVAPGFVNTELTADRLASAEGAEIKAQSPFNRVAEPKEVAHAVLFLASSGAEFSTGAVIDVNGASYLR